MALELLRALEQLTGAADNLIEDLEKVGSPLIGNTLNLRFQVSLSLRGLCPEQSTGGYIRHPAFN